MNDNDQQKRLKELEEKWMSNTITPQEAQEYADWYNRGQGAPVPVPKSFADNEEDLEKRMLDSIKEKAGIEKPVITIRRSRPWKWVAAASVLIIAGIAGYWWLTSAPQSSIAGNDHADVMTNEAQPGSDKAVLQLADGSTIVLEGARNGELTSQGSATVIKSNGELRYDVAHAQGETVFNTISTPRGGQYKLTLADGTMVWLNSASSLKYPSTFAGNERRVELSGEAYFEVAKNAQQPFFVETGTTAVQVLGTHFNVNGYPNEYAVRTTLLEGSVKVMSQKEKMTLSPGNQAEVVRASEQINIRKDVDVQQVMAWQKGMFEFRNADLAIIARQLSRWYDVDVEVKGTNEKLRLGGGISKRLKLSEVLGLLEAYHVKHDWQNGKVILYQE